MTLLFSVQLMLNNFIDLEASILIIRLRNIMHVGKRYGIDF